MKEQVKHNHVSILFVKGEPELREEFEQLGAVVSGPVIAGWSSLGLLLKTWIWVLANPLLIIHAHLPHAELIATFLKGPFSTLINSRHNSEPFFPKGSVRTSRILSRIATSRSKGVIAISHDVHNHLRVNHEVSKQKEIYVIHYGFHKTELSGSSKNKFEVRNRYGIGTDDLLVGTISRLVPQKDIPTMLEGFSIFKKKFKNAKLIIVGDGDLHDELVEKTYSLGIGPSVIWVGRTSEINAHLDAMDMFVLTSRYEGFGMVILEAMNRKIPVVASNCSAIPEVLGENYGFLFEMGSSKSLGEKLQELNAMPTLELNKKREALYARLDLFDPGIMSDLVMGTYTKNE